MGMFKAHKRSGKLTHWAIFFATFICFLRFLEHFCKRPLEDFFWSCNAWEGQLAFLVRATNSRFDTFKVMIYFSVN